ncbi:MAG TPA: hypothetical protein VGM37_04255 [Armatimonadota bacterium]|jgi:isopropylmalate/homocitrate/citramalate synthase
MGSSFDGVSIQMTVSSARPGEAAFRETTVEDANARICALIRRRVEALYPGAAVAVETGGDQPSATVSGTDDLHLRQQIKYGAEKTALGVKWDFSTLGLGLKE